MRVGVGMCTPVAKSGKRSHGTALCFRGICGDTGQNAGQTSSRWLQKGAGSRWLESGGTSWIGQACCSPKRDPLIVYLCVPETEAGERSITGCCLLGVLSSSGKGKTMCKETHPLVKRNKQGDRRHGQLE